MCSSGVRETSWIESTAPSEETHRRGRIRSRSALRAYSMEEIGARSISPASRRAFSSVGTPWTSSTSTVEPVEDRRHVHVGDAAEPDHASCSEPGSWPSGGSKNVTRLPSRSVTENSREAPRLVVEHGVRMHDPAPPRTPACSASMPRTPDAHTGGDRVLRRDPARPVQMNPRLALADDSEVLLGEEDVEPELIAVPGGGGHDVATGDDRNGGQELGHCRSPPPQLVVERVALHRDAARPRARSGRARRSSARSRSWRRPRGRSPRARPCPGRRSRRSAARRPRAACPS